MKNKHKNKILAAALAAILIIPLIITPFWLNGQLQENNQSQVATSNSSTVIILSSSSISDVVSSSSSVIFSSSIAISSSSVSQIVSEVAPIVESTPEVVTPPTVIEPVIQQEVVERFLETPKPVFVQPIVTSPPHLVVETPPVVVPTPPPAPKVNLFTNANCSYSLASQMLSLVNEHRANNGVEPLSLAGDLNGVACAHSQWMRETDIFSHTGRDGTDPFERCNRAGTVCYGENVAYNTDTTVLNLFNQFKESPGHNANMLESRFEEIGLGFSGVYVSQMFR